ncbi:fructosamine kinase family protein [Pseudanabaena biceps]|nr:fructosamine kinase family protein [Pseudanabaena biceps]
MQNSWNEVAIAISQATGTKFVINKKQSQSGGCINQATKISDGNRHFFVKTNQASFAEIFALEAIALQEMYSTHTIRVPQPICWGATDDTAYLVMEDLDLGGSQDWEAMGRNLATLHRITSDRGFGRDHNNVIGATPQVNNWTSNWIDFWIEYRLGFQINLAKRRGWQCPVPEQKLYASVSRYFEDYQPQPSMVHGDLWSGNADFVNGEPVIFDPALYFGDREVDLAMTELFGGFPAQFYRAYNDAYPLDSGYQQRKSLYNLYHILNHFHLFGGSYGSQSNQMIKSLVIKE